MNDNFWEDHRAKRADEGVKPKGKVGMPRRQPYDKVEAHLIKHKSISVPDAQRLYDVHVKTLSRMMKIFSRDGMIIEKTREKKYGTVIGTYHFRGMKEEN